MDGSQFDTLIKRLATTPLTRPTALRGVAASLAALAGVTLAAEPGGARNRNNNDEPERKVCHCADATAASCQTLKKEKSKVKKHLKQHACDYIGSCQGFSGCCIANTQTCASSAQCCSGFCGDGTCRPAGSCLVL